ncbi:hypothetical protein F5Y16DRAFT_417381 [Xylariaceae sp. FL0255]|nr:hypothetical protein F5Y16DRAFT_417381 [Xylariaceae sp. FL0255]
MSSVKTRPIIHINGFPGTGKLTIARLLQSKLGGNKHCRMIHNHLLINPADAVLRRTEPGYRHLRKSIRSAVFTTLISNEATHDIVYIFTDFQSSDLMGSATCAEYLEMSEARGCALISVILSCEEEVNAVRLRSAERLAHGKIVDEELLRGFRADLTVHRFDFASGNGTELELDVTHLTAEEAAQAVYEHVLRLYPEMKQGPT